MQRLDKAENPYPFIQIKYEIITVKDRYSQYISQRRELLTGFMDLAATGQPVEIRNRKLLDARQYQIHERPPLYEAAFFCFYLRIKRIMRITP